MTGTNTKADEERTDDEFETTVDARAFDDQDDRGPPSACPGCGREVTLLGNGFCGFCQDEAPDDGGDAQPDGGDDLLIPARDVRKAVEAAFDEADGYDDPDRRAYQKRGAEAVLEALDIPMVLADGGREGPHPTVRPSQPTGADPSARPVDARRAVVDAARKPGVDVHRGVYTATRTTLSTWVDRQDVEAVVLKRMDLSGRVVATLEATPLTDLRDDLDVPTDLEGQRPALPEGDFDVDDLFVDGASSVSLPGLAVPSNVDGDDG